MVQVIRAADRGPTQREKNAQGFKEAFNTIREYKEKENAKASSDQDRAMLETQYPGLKLSSNPEIAKLQIQAAEKERQRDAGFKRRMELWGFGEENNHPSKTETYTPNIDFNADVDELITSKPKTKGNEKEFKPIYSPKQIALASAEDPVQARIMNDQNIAAERAFYKEKEADVKKGQEDRRIFESDRDFHTKVSRPIIEEAANTIKSYEIVNNDLDMAEKAVESGETSGLFPFLVDKMGLETFRNPESALFNNSIKNLFVSSLNDIPGARPNQFIERYLSAAQPSLGRSVLSNLAPIYLQKFREDVKNERAKLELEIAKEDREKFGYVKEDVAERANDRLGDYVNRRQEQFATQLQERKEKEMLDADILNEIIGKTVVPGTPLTSRTIGLLWLKNGKNLDKAVEEADSLGYQFPKYMGE